jgi:hypothetical protein
MNKPNSEDTSAFNCLFWLASGLLAEAYLWAYGLVGNSADVDPTTVRNPVP